VKSMPLFLAENLQRAAHFSHDFQTIQKPRSSRWTWPDFETRHVEHGHR